MAESLGGVMKVGYTPFGWGQQSQLLPIYKGFGIDMIFFYRGITAKEIGGSEFAWEGADGTTLLASRFGSNGRYNFYLAVWRPAFFDHLPHRMARRFHWDEGGAIFRLCDEDNRYDHGDFHDPARRLNYEAVATKFRERVELEKRSFTTPEVAYMNGFDTSTPDLREVDVFHLCQKNLKEGETLEFSSLPRYVEAVKSHYRDGIEKLPKIRGEVRFVKLNEYGYSWIGNDIISARTRQKYFTAHVESYLERIAEPAVAMAAWCGKSWPQRYFDIAWKQFLKCHPHDTIGGCGIDPIEEDAMYRLRDSLSLSRMLAKEGLRAIVDRIDSSRLPSRAIRITVFNMMPCPRSGLVEAYVDIPRELGMTQATLLDSEGKTIPFEIEATGIDGKVFRDHSDLALGGYLDEHLLRFRAEDVPGCGYRTYLLRSAEPEKDAARPVDLLKKNVVSMPTFRPSIVRDAKTLENEYLVVTVAEDGTFAVRDKESGEVYSGLASASMKMWANAAIAGPMSNPPIPFRSSRPPERPRFTLRAEAQSMERSRSKRFFPFPVPRISTTLRRIGPKEEDGVKKPSP